MHRSSGSIPWDLALTAYLEWQSKNGYSLSVDDALSRIAARGGFGHDFMDRHFGSREWFEHFAERNIQEVPLEQNDLKEVVGMEDNYR